MSNCRSVPLAQLTSLWSGSSWSPMRKVPQFIKWTHAEPKIRSLPLNFSDGYKLAKNKPTDFVDVSTLRKKTECSLTTWGLWDNINQNEKRSSYTCVPYWNLTTKTRYLNLLEMFASLCQMWNVTLSVKNTYATPFPLSLCWLPVSLSLVNDSLAENPYGVSVLEQPIIKSGQPSSLLIWIFSGL